MSWITQKSANSVQWVMIVNDVLIIWITLKPDLLCLPCCSWGHTIYQLVQAPYVMVRQA